MKLVNSISAYFTEIFGFDCIFHLCMSRETIENAKNCVLFFKRPIQQLFIWCKFHSRLRNSSPSSSLPKAESAANNIILTKVCAKYLAFLSHGWVTYLLLISMHCSHTKASFFHVQKVINTKTHDQKCSNVLFRSNVTF